MTTRAFACAALFMAMPAPGLEPALEIDMDMPLVAPEEKKCPQFPPWGKNAPTQFAEARA